MDQIRFLAMNDIFSVVFRRWRYACSSMSTSSLHQTLRQQLRASRLRLLFPAADVFGLVGQPGFARPDGLSPNRACRSPSSVRRLQNASPTTTLPYWKGFVMLGPSLCGRFPPVPQTPKTVSHCRLRIVRNARCVIGLSRDVAGARTRDSPLEQCGRRGGASPQVRAACVSGGVLVTA